MGREERLKEVYEHVRKTFPIHTQGDFSESLKYNRAYISSAMHGNEKNLTDKLFRNICETYPGVFNLDYLLTGEGTLLADQGAQEPVESVPATTSMPPGYDNLVELLSRAIRESDDLRVQLKKDLGEIQAIKDDLHQAVNDFRNATYRLTQALAQINANNSARTPQMGLAADEEPTV